MPFHQPDTIPASFFDTAVAGMTEAFISQIHLVVDYDRQVDPDRLAKTCRLLLDSEPVLGCLYQPKFFRSHWSRLTADRLDAESGFRFFENNSSNENELIDILLGGGLDPSSELPIKFFLVRGDYTDRLIIKIDHQVSDAGGLKYLARRLADIYNRLENDPAYQPTPNDAPRDQGQIYQQYLPGRFADLMVRYCRDLKAVFYPVGNLMFPMARNQTGTPVFIYRRFDPERVERARSFAARHGATVNDLAAAVLFRAFASATNWTGRQTLRMVGTVDMRRYLAPGHGQSVSNLSGWYFLNLGKDLGENIGDTLQKIRNQTELLKNDYIGLGFNLFGYIILRPIPYSIRTWYMNLNIRMFNRIGNMPPTLTNMGNINYEILGLGKAEVTNAFLLVPPAVPPVLAMGLSGCRGSLTLSAGIFESAVPRYGIEDLFDRFDREWPG